ncbi:phage protein [Streptococcus lutetiensis]|uniref:phage tail protein n=1 Tax=Streptococcus lutetiensis TaxID=150055 RepID=UPI000F719104|nr:phage tail protein [Streptococcus lutetiensis]VEB81326.1 phage protein [Streptococcus lutetiensis]
MITFLDERDVEHGALATIKVTNAVNGERSLTGEIESGDYVLTNIERGWRLRFDDEFYVVTYAKPIDDGKGTHVTFDAVHQFFWDFDKSSVHEQLNDGSHTFLTYLDFIFTGSDYTYTIDPLLKVYAFEKQSFGYKSRLKLFNDVITSSGVEFQVNGKVVRILEKTGTDLSTVVRKNFNMNELGIEKNIGDFVTYQKGFGAWIDENDHSKGRLVTEYTSPLASVYGKLEAEPLVDERYTQADNMIAALKANVDNSYSISITLDMEDLTRAGYDYTQPRAGDYIMAINETLDFQEKIRIVSFTSEYDVSGQLVKHEVTCNDIGVVKKLSASYNLAKEQAQNASDSVGKAVEMANKALVSADGKSTVYFGNEFPKDEPKGTLHKGDSLYLTVGDTTKMYYWTGADWEELPIVNDVEAFKEQIADELKDVPNREEFEATITEKLATSKAEIKTQIDTAKTQAESNAKAYADEINQATAEVAEQANTAANSLKSDLAKVKTDLTTTTSTANAAKTSASEAKQQLTTVANDLSKAKTDLQNAVSAVDTKATNLQSDVSNLNTSLSNTAKALQTQGMTLANQAKELQTQASQLTAQAKAQETLTTRVENVETTANGTKTTVSELSKTVTQNGKDITSVSNRTKTVETSLTSAKTSISELQTSVSTAQTDLTNLTKRTKTVEDGLTGTKTNLSELTQTVSNDGKTIASLTSRTKTVEDSVSGLKTTMSSVQKDLTAVTTRTKTVEDDLSGTKTTLSQVQTTANSASQKTAALETGLNGLGARFSSLKIGGRNLLTKTNQGKTNWSWAISSGGTTAENYDVDGVNAVKLTRTKDSPSSWDYIRYQGLLRNLIEPDTKYTLSFDVKPSVDVTFTASLRRGDSGAPLTNSTTMNKATANQWNKVSCVLTSKATLSDDLSQVVYLLGMPTANGNTVMFKNIKLEKGNIATDYSPNEADIESKVAEYKQNADQNYASLQTTVQNLDGTVQQNKTVADQTAQGFKTRIESLETYKSGESTRANQYFESAKTETARQLTAERTAIAKDYVAKSTYTSDVTGIRNDLTATTTTANTTKTNLANYQASNDKAVANLQSSLKTTNGNVSSLQTKIEAVPGQISSAVSAVEGKIPTEIGSSNLLRNTAVNADNLKLFGTSNSTISIVTKDGHQTYKIVVSATNNSGVVFNGNAQYYNLIKDRSYTFSFWVLTNKDKSYSFESLGHIQVCNGNGDQVGNDIAHQHTTPVYSTNTIKANTWTKVWCTFKATSNSYFKPYFWYLKTGDEIYIYDMMLNEGKIPLSYTPAVEDTQSDITKLNTTLTQTANGLKQLSTQVTSQGSTITSHTNSINSLTTGLSAKVSQTDFNTLSGRVTTAENNIIAKANELSSKITSVEGKIPSGEMNLVEYGRPADGHSPYNNVEYATHPFYYNSAFKMYIIKNTTTTEKLVGMNRFKVERNTDYTLYFKGFNNSAITNMDVWFLKRVSGSTKDFDSAQILVSGRKLSTSKAEDISVTFNTGNYDEGYIRFDNNGSKTAGTQSDLFFGDVSVKKGKSNNGWSPSLAELASSQDLKNAQSEIKQTTDSIKASVSSLDKSTVKSASLTINTDGIVMKAGKSTTDVANAIGSYFAVNQNAINLFSDKINVKGSMIVDGAITSNKIASKSINTAHLNGKIITADVIATNAVTANAIKAGAVTTDKMIANSINGDRITAGTLDAAKIKAGSITASQIASGTITSAQIKTGTISAANIAAGAITTDKIAANSINSSKIVSSGITANVIKGGKLQSLSNATNFELDTGKLFYNNNNTGIFRVQANASTMGLKFSNTSITVSGTSRILSRVILGGDRRETSLDDGKWDQGGFTGIVAETINGVDSNAHSQADTLRVIGDNIYFTHSYNYDAQTKTSAQGWKMETFSPFSSYAGNVVLKPYGINYRQSDIITGDVRLDNGDGSGYWVRGCIRTLRNCFQHYLNGGTTSGAMNAIRDALKEISGV